MKYGRTTAPIKRQFTAIYDRKLYETTAYVIFFGRCSDRDDRPGLFYSVQMETIPIN
jgi:hypothetical protein